VRQTLKLTGVGCLALVLGALIYVVVRPEGSSYLNQGLSSFIPGLSYFPFINNLPSFFHVVSFSLLTAVVLAGRKYAVLNCLTWLTVNVVFEVGQHTLVQHFLEHQVELPQLLEGYFQRGRFDVLDIAFSVLGALVAYYVIWLSWSRRLKGD
jgi:hypothetical protein